MRFRSSVSISSAAIVAWAIGLAACGSSGEPPTEVVASTHEALVGIEGMFEYAIDAPWRMEPRGSGDARTYGALPIQVSIHDALHVGDDNTSKGATAGRDGPEVTPPTIGRVCRLGVRDAREGGVTSITSIPVRDFDEIERSLGEWSFPPGSQANGPPRESCAKSGPMRCDQLASSSLSGTSEWHGLVLYEARNPRPDARVRLDFELAVSRGPGQCAEIEALEPFSEVPPEVATRFYRLRNHVSVRYAADALPRIGNAIYGDLHYHSQGTDNEGESGYNYRGVSRAMQAIGLDFLWATEHASASEQLTDLDAKFVDWKVQYPIEYPGKLKITGRRGALRDMDSRRFRVMSQLIQEANVSAAARGAASASGRVPQIFLGGEVDVIPETNRPSSDTIKYGADHFYDPVHLCGSLKKKVSGSVMASSCGSDAMSCYNVYKSDTTTCSPDDLYVATTDGSGVNLIRDLQGINDRLYGREHMVYLPRPAPGPGEDPFVASSTSTYGGATRTLVDHRIHVDAVSGEPVNPSEPGYDKEIAGVIPEVEHKGGKLFIAHHLLNLPIEGTNGPDGPPWSESMLEQAWRSPAVLGLEFWNEDARLRSVAGTPGYERNSAYYAGHLAGFAMYEVIPLSNRSRAGLDASSNGVFDLLTGGDAIGARWGEATHEVEDTLTDGAVSWDRMNLRGIDA